MERWNAWWWAPDEWRAGAEEEAFAAKGGGGGGGAYAYKAADPSVGDGPATDAGRGGSAV